jgi:glycosyltransferase involved in cell wall biosynthesis
MIRISVIVPCFNAEQFIGSCLESVANQTLQPCEVIVVDDGSTDGSPGVIQSSPLPVRVLQSPRRGGAGARNVGIRAAEGEWLAFLDADDIWYPNHLERAVEIIQAAVPVGYINHYDHLDPDGRIVPRRNPRFNSVVEGSGLDDYISHFVQYRHFVGMSACLVERRRALAVGGMDEGQVRRHDIEFWLRVVHGQRWVFDPMATSAYRKLRPGGLSANSADAALDGFHAFLRHRDKVVNRRLYDTVLQERARSAITHALASKDASRLQRAYQAAAPCLGWKHKLLLGFLTRFPSLFRMFRSVRLA